MKWYFHSVAENAEFGVLMRVQRYPARRRPAWPFIACGCGAVLVASAVCVVALGLLGLRFAPELALRVAGFQPAGQTDSVFAVPEVALPVLNNPAALPPAAIVVDAGQLGRRSLGEVNSGGVSVVVGSAAGTAQTVVQAAVDETGLLDLCRRYTTVCSPAGDAVRNVTFDLRPGGVIVRGEFLVPQAGLWQPAGIVLRLNAASRLEIAGVDVNGVLFSTPPGELSALVEQVTATANDLLRQVAVETGGARYTLERLVITDDAVTALLR